MATETADALSLPTTHVPPVPPSSATPLVSRLSKPKIRITTPSLGTPDNSPLTPNQPVDPTDPQNLQYNIYLQLVNLNANTKIRNKTPLTPIYRYPPYISRRSMFWTSTQQTSTPASSTLEGAEFDALGQHFTTLVIISTFTANLIIAFLALAHSLISGRQDIYTYSTIVEVGQFLALVGMAAHAGVIIISGRCAALALKHAKKFTVQAKLADEQKEEEYDIPDESDSERMANRLEPPLVTDDRPPITTTTQTAPESNSGPLPPNPKDPSFPSLKSFHRFLTVCETLQFFGTAIFFLGVTVLLFLIFLHSIFPIVLTVGCVIGIYALSWLVGFWEISASKQLVTVAWSVWTRWMFNVAAWVGSICSGRSASSGQRKKTDIPEPDLEKGEATKSV